MAWRVARRSLRRSVGADAGKRRNRSHARYKVTAFRIKW
jgi:hypothetical protein